MIKSRLATILGRRRALRALDLGDVRAINDSLVEMCRRVPPSDYRERLASMTIAATAPPHEGGEILRRNGILVVADALAPEEADALADRVVRAADQRLETEANGSGGTDAVVQGLDGPRLRYGEMAMHHLPVIELRAGQDAGMIDIFNVDRLLDSPEMRAPFETDTLAELVRQAGYRAVARNLNAYVNRGVAATRGFHVDSYGPQLKAFIYLTDVERLDDGPYTYVPGSHVDSAFRRANQKLSISLPNSTEAPVVPPTSVLPVLARRGSLVISDQAGFHRGFPQSADGVRVAIVMSYS